MDNVHLPIHTPLRELNSIGKIDDFHVRFIKLNIKKLENRICKPCDIRFGPVHEFIKILDAVQAHKGCQVCVFNVFRGWLPYGLTAEV